MKEPRLIGLTGGIGSGKSTVAGILRAERVAVVDADEAARAVVQPGTDGLAQIVTEFGPDFLSPDGSLDRPRLAELVFASPDQRRRLEAITHPLVRAWMAERTMATLESGHQLIVHEIPLLYEIGLDVIMRAVIVVWVPRAVQVERLVNGQGYTREHAEARIDAQLPIDEKRDRAGIVIDNSGTIAQTTARTLAAWATVQSSV